MLFINQDGNVEIDMNGYLSDSDETSPIWINYNNLFLFSKQVNTFMYELLELTEPKDNDVIACFIVETFSKIHKDYQSGIILAARGLADQTKVILRIILDKLMIMKAVQLDSNNYNLWLKQQAKNRNTIINEIRNKRPGLKHLYNSVKDYELSKDAEKVPVSKWAKLAEMEEEYNVTYRLFSENVHYSIRSFSDNLIVEDGTTAAILIGPQLEEIEIILTSLITDAMKAASIVLDHFNIAKDKYTELDKILESWQVVFMKSSSCQEK